MFGIGAGEFIVILIVGLIVFGPSKLPEVGRALGKGLREFRKAQAALSQTLNEVDISEKKSPPAEKAISNEKIADKKISVEQSAPVDAARFGVIDTGGSSLTADDIINLAKESPIVKEKSNEKISDGTSNVAPVDAARAGVAGTGSSSNGVDKQSKPSTN